MMVPQLELAQVRRLLAVDDRSQVLLVAERAGALCGIAGYYPAAAGSGLSEVPLAVADAMHWRGLGTRMLERLAEIARERGIRAFDAFVLGENLAMMDVFLQSGFTLTQGLDQGGFHVALQPEHTLAYTAGSGRRSQLAAASSIRPFFEARSIAVIGASRRPGHIGSEILRNLRESGFTGTLPPVHPSADIVGGLKACPTIAAIPGAVDLAVVVVPAANVNDVVGECLAKGVKAIVVISAGFSEVGGAGQALQTALMEKIRSAGDRLIGPNWMCTINADPAVRLNATLSRVYPPEGRIACSTQSGALGLAILDYVTRLNI